MKFPFYKFLDANLLRGREKTTGYGTSTLDWRENSCGRESAASAITLKDFAKFLKAAGILDNMGIDMHGAAVWFPYGMRLRKLFDQVISEKYELFGLQHHLYPSILPAENFDSISTLYNLANKLLYVATDQQLARGESRTVLSPTGETAIYKHWAKYIREQHLPVKMYSNSCYYRPVRNCAGMGIFNSMEASGVFEFHAAYKDRSTIPEEIYRYHQMLEEVFTFFRVPRIWSLRPRWTNNGAVSIATFGVDTILPNNTSLQIGAIYDQDSIFSEIFNIFIKKKSKKAYVKQIAGFCSRRLLLSQLMITSSIFGKFFIHPNFSPIQIAVIFQKNNGSCVGFDDILPVMNKLAPLRYALELCDSARQTVKKFNDFRVRGVPLIALIQDKRNRDDDYNVILHRTDNGTEFKTNTNDLKLQLPLYLSRAISEISHSTDGKIDDYYNSRWASHCIENTSELLSCTSPVKMFRLAHTEKNVNYIEKLIPGEVIGFVQTETLGKCLLTASDVTTQAILCRRF